MLRRCSITVLRSSRKSSWLLQICDWDILSGGLTLRLASFEEWEMLICCKFEYSTQHREVVEVVHFLNSF